MPDAKTRDAVATNSDSRAVIANRLVGKLSPRQKQVLERMVDGFRNKQIAAHLKIDEKTVKMHRARLIEALQVGSSAGAIKIAVEASFVSSR